MTSLRLALGLFTVFPAGAPSTDRRSVRGALVWAPAIGLLLGLLTAGVLLAARTLTEAFWTLPPPANPLGHLLAAALAIICLTLLSGGLHVDGLADTADGWAARGDKHRTMTVMADPAVGAFGAYVVAADLLVQTAALALAVSRGHGTEAVVVAAVTGRLAMVWAATRAPARRDGMGAWVGGSVGVVAAAVLTLLTLIGAGVLAALDDDATRRAGLVVVAAVPVGLAVAAAATWPMRRRLGGITGDLLGATCQVATAAVLVSVACAP